MLTLDVLLGVYLSYRTLRGGEHHSSFLPASPSAATSPATFFSLVQPTALSRSVKIGCEKWYAEYIQSASMELRFWICSLMSEEASSVA